jgi:lauroyl/myristoyl acyltransferase
VGAVLRPPGLHDDAGGAAGAQTGAAIAVAWCERLPRGRGYVVRVLPLAEPLPATPAGDAPGDEADAAVINRALEAVIRQRPAQYLWGYAPLQAAEGLHVKELAARALLALLWLLQPLPLAWHAALGRALGAVLWRLAGARRRIALRNLELCLPELPAAERAALARQHFGWLGRSLLERGLLWYASPARLRRLIHVEGDVHLAERSERPVMWLVPHFLALDVAGAATQLFQAKMVGSIYQAQSNEVFDAAIRRGRLRFGLAQIFSRTERALPLVRAIRAAMPSSTCPTWTSACATPPSCPSSACRRRRCWRRRAWRAA